VARTTDSTSSQKTISQHLHLNKFQDRGDTIKLCLMTFPIIDPWALSDLALSKKLVT
jgi:hypothetical protein